MPGTRGRGRPREPAIAERILRATLEVCGERGWSGLSMEAVARRAHVGKSSLYLRYANKAVLLEAALVATAPTPAPRGEGDAPASLLRVALHIKDWMDGPSGAASALLVLESRLLPEVLGPIAARLQAALGGVTRALIELCGDAATPEHERAVRAEALAGALLMRSLFTVRLDDQALVRDPVVFVQEVVALTTSPSGPGAG